jgi:hypothetical protein
MVAKSLQLRGWETYLELYITIVFSHVDQLDEGETKLKGAMLGY